MENVEWGVGLLHSAFGTQHSPLGTQHFSVAGVAELADAADLKSAEGSSPHQGSTPCPGTISFRSSLSKSRSSKHWIYLYDGRRRGGPWKIGVATAPID